MTTISVNWYKSTGKWYAHCALPIPDDFEPATGDLRGFVEIHQTELSDNWVNGDWFVTVSAKNQPDSDCRFFERLYKYGSV